MGKCKTCGQEEKIVLRKRKGAEENDTIKFKKGGLHRSMGVPESYKFNRAQVGRLEKVSVGSTFKTPGGKSKKMTEKIHDQLSLAHTMMGWKK